ncbi:DNA repair protein RecN [Zavarzinia sp. CC-PAN008]|uniref:DNA repair protein RecN n=1 Tax=Zavarzinia sp. CC-PAN008 TaxID=3243332 RepID=UPI003F743C6C
MNKVVLRRLSVRDIVLIDRLDLDFEPGLTVLTGETGAGKSILLDALGLALGARAQAGLVRSGAAQGSAAAQFDVPPGHPARRLLEEQDLGSPDEPIVLRRVVGADGRSRAYACDSPVSAGLLSELGSLLVEVHGQHDERGLLAASGHRAILDTFGALDPLVAEVGQAWRSREAARQALAEATRRRDEAMADQDYLRHIAAELEALSPQPGEEDELAAERTLLSGAERLAEDVADVVTTLEQGGGPDVRLRAALRKLERVAERAQGRLDETLAALERAASEAAEAIAALEAAQGAIRVDPRRLEIVEERLFALRAAARKHNIRPDELPDFTARTLAQVAALEGVEDQLKDLARTLSQAELRYAELAGELTGRRRQAATRLDRAVESELESLKLGRARFRTAVAPLAEGGEAGADRVAFEISTNPGAPFGALIRIASGGELSRFILALKVALAGVRSAATMVFDEVDRGVGGAVAAAVGDRLGALAGDAQVLVVTHSPQVAARGDHHLHIAKSDTAEGTRTRVVPLDHDAREEEIARMLAGAEVTDAARAAARSLRGGG